MQWTVTHSRSVYRDRWLSIRADNCRLPNGTEVAPYYVLEYPDWVNVVAITTLDEVVLVRQYRHGLGEVTLELPCGVVDPGDPSPLEAARRELLEETGFSAASWRKTGELSANPATHNNRTHCILATGCVKSAAPRLDATEDLEIVLVPLAELPRLARANLVQSLHVAAVFFALSDLGRIQYPD